jgi:hypothetical protein
MAVGTVKFFNMNKGFGFITPEQGGKDVANSTGLIGYTFYDLTDFLALGMRNEWYKADGKSYYTNTFGVNVKPIPNMVLRPEIRINSNGSGSTTMSPFNQTILGVDGIFLF